MDGRLFNLPKKPLSGLWLGLGTKITARFKTADPLQTCFCLTLYVFLFHTGQRPAPSPTAVSETVHSSISQQACVAVQKAA